MHFHCGFKVEIVCPFKCKFHWGSNNLAPYHVKRIKTDSAGVIKPFIIWSAFQKQPHDHIYCIKLASCCCFLNCFGAQITGSNSNESKCVIRSQMSDRKKEKKQNSKQLWGHQVASIRWRMESGSPLCFLHLSPCVNQTFCHSAQTRGRGIMSSYLFCTKMKYLLGVNTYQEQTMGRGASSSQTHIWLPPPQRPNHVLGVFSDSGKSASFESTFQSPCWTAGLCWNWRETCVHTF